MADDFSWQSDSGYHHVWPELEFGWRVVAATAIGFLGASFGSVGGILVPMLTLIIGFDPKSSIAISKCMITGTATVFYNLKLRHPTLDLPIVEYDLVLLIQPVLLLDLPSGSILTDLQSDTASLFNESSIFTPSNWVSRGHQ